MVLVKDNHIAVAGGVAESIAAVSQYLKQNNLNIGVEVRKKFAKQCFTYLFSTWYLFCSNINDSNFVRLEFIVLFAPFYFYIIHTYNSEYTSQQ